MEPVRQIGDEVLRSLLAAMPWSAEKLTCAWQVTAGAAVARVTAVSHRSGVIEVAVPSAEWARELERSRDVLLSRLQAVLGSDTCRRLVIVERRLVERASCESP